MPIFVYEPAEDTTSLEIIAGRECCYFETLQWSNEQQLAECSDCGRPIRRALAGFARSSFANPDPLRGVAKALGDGINAGVSDTSSGGKSDAKSLISADGKSPAARAARLAYKHVCGKSCRH